MDKIPYIKYARYVMSIKQDSFGLSGSLRYAEDNYKLYFVFEEEWKKKGEKGLCKFKGKNIISNYNEQN